MFKKPKIAIFHCGFIYTGGGERIVIEQLKHLLKRGYQVSCFTPVMDAKHCYPDIFNKYSVKTFLPQLPEWFPLKHAILLLLTSFLAPFLAFRFRDTDLFIGENQPGTWLAYVISRLLGKPYIIYTCHPNRMVYPRNLSRKEIWRNQKDFYWLSIFFEFLKPILKYLDRVSFTNSDFPVLVNGYSVGQEFERIYRVPWIDCPSGAPFVKEKSKILTNSDVFKGEIEIGKVRINKPYLLYVGRHEVWKRIDLAIKAMAEIIKVYPHVKLIIQGPDSRHTETLEKLVKELHLQDKILFFTDDQSQERLRKLYFNTVALLFPSEKEDFGIVIIEAMGAGVPVVAWKSGGPKDIIVNKQTGFLAKPFSLDDFAQKAVLILGDETLRRQMSLASWERVKNHFSWEKHINILEKEIQKILIRA